MTGSMNAKSKVGGDGQTSPWPKWRASSEGNRDRQAIVAGLLAIVQPLLNDCKWACHDYAEERRKSPAEQVEKCCGKTTRNRRESRGTEGLGNIRPNPPPPTSSGLETFRLRPIPTLYLITPSACNPPIATNLTLRTAAASPVIEKFLFRTKLLSVSNG